MLTHLGGENYNCTLCVMMVRRTNINLPPRASRVYVESWQSLWLVNVVRLQRHPISSVWDGLNSSSSAPCYTVPTTENNQDLFMEQLHKAVYEDQVTQRSDAQSGGLLLYGSRLLLTELQVAASSSSGISLPHSESSKGFSRSFMTFLTWKGSNTYPVVTARFRYLYVLKEYCWVILMFHIRVYLFEVTVFCCFYCILSNVVSQNIFWIVCIHTLHMLSIPGINVANVLLFFS